MIWIGAVEYIVTAVVDEECNSHQSPLIGFVN